MTIFHVIQYPITDIENQTELDSLPIEVSAKWCRRVEDYAIEQAKSVVHLDKTGKAQNCIDAIFLYRDGKISSDKLKDAANAAAYAYAAASASASAAYAYAAASAAASAATYAGDAAAAYTGDAVYYATGAAYYATGAADWNTSRQDTLDLFKKWLTEELYNYDMGYVCQNIQ